MRLSHALNQLALVEENRDLIAKHIRPGMIVAGVILFTSSSSLSRPNMYGVGILHRCEAY